MGVVSEQSPLSEVQAAFQAGDMDAVAALLTDLSREDGACRYCGLPAPEGQHPECGPTSPLVSGAEAAEIAGVAYRTWMSYVSRRQPKSDPAPEPARRVGRTPLWDREEVVAWQKRRS